ncbi:MAG: hypothetical protein Q6L60_04020 [Thermostichus sp. HHBFW_bins_43]
MDRETGWFGLKLMVAAAGISVAVKYGGPYLALPETMPVVIGMILLPTAIMAGILYRWQRNSASAPKNLQGSPTSTQGLTPEESPQSECD